MNSKTTMMLASAMFIVSLCVGTGQVAHASKIESAPASGRQSTKEALDLPMSERVDAIRAQGTAGYRNLVSVMFDTHEEMETRWRAVTATARVAGMAAMPEINRALSSSEWFMRNAGLVALTPLDRSAALSWAHKLLNDKALVVRLAAVDAMSNLKDDANSDLLWTKLYSRDNYRGQQSLFIRRRIVEALAHLETGSEGKFIKVLGDKDETLHPVAIAALERITKRHLGGQQEPVKYKKAEWQRWWKENASRM